MSHNYWIYIVECSDKSYYIGVTNDIEVRIWQHNNSENIKSYTFKRRPVKLIYRELFFDINDAISREKQIKGWSRKKKEALIEKNYDNLVQYSQRKSANK